MFRQYRLFQRIFRLYSHRKPGIVNFRQFKNIIKLNLLTGTKICCTALMAEKVLQESLEDDITKALQEGEDAIIKLMNQLKDFVVVVSQEYRSCLLKQMEIVKKASDLGSSTEIWDELPHYRTLASELNNEIIEYYTLFKTLDALAKNKSVLRDTGDHVVKDVLQVFQEIQTFIEMQVAENQKMEKELLKVLADSIIKETIQDVSSEEY
ncbi:uncharacterized protein LOC114331310 isoform X2 [Diabrotica virgifera virgifera]|uniref:Uncharacterized protein LOC114331310 isoform X2 n=1 Tax=Diabrotica virgifera virgifera TaxID=50390 RepID=A0A6P7FKG0_DIAVI|nr:uncharacterized protein LOC114331310 isoform X2 [Diabrotica virgifera virgifera]